jgi:hypothetical protein
VRQWADRAHPDDVVAAKQTQTRRTKGGPPRLVALGFLIAFAASVLTLIYTGLLARSPGSGPAHEPRRGDQAAVAEARPKPAVADTGAADAPDAAARAQASRGRADEDRDDEERDGESTASGPAAGSRAPAD